MRAVINSLVILAILSCTEVKNSRQFKLNIVDENGIGIPEAQYEVKSVDTVVIGVADLEGNVIVEKIESNSCEISVQAVGFISLKNYEVDIRDSETLKIELKQFPLDSIQVEWEGGWMTIQSEDGQYRTIRIEE